MDTPLPSHGNPLLWYHSYKTGVMFVVMESREATLMSKRDQILAHMQESYIEYFKQHGPTVIDEAAQTLDQILDRGGSRELAYLQACMHISHSAVTAALNIVADEIAGN